MRPNTVKRALLQGEIQIGTRVNALGVPQIARMVATAGFDFLSVPGLLVQDVASARAWIARGIRLVPYASEVSLLVQARARAVEEIRGFARERPLTFPSPPAGERGKGD